MGNNLIQIWNEPARVEEIEFVTGINRRIFKLKNAYRPNTGELKVFYNGVRAIKDYEYEETDPNTVTFLFDLNEPDIIIFEINRLG